MRYHVFLTLQRMYLQKSEIEKKLFLFFKQECITALVHQYPLNNKDINSSEINIVNVS